MEDKCLTCGAELVPATSFCRKCGAAVNAKQSLDASEQPTTLLQVTDPAVTQRLDPRPTGNRDKQTKTSSPAAGDANTRSPRKGRYALIAGVAIIVIIATLCVVGFVALKRHRASEVVLYPGAKTTTDMKYEDGSRALSLETSDSLDAVEAWYQKQLRPQKTIRLNPHSVVLKNERTTATIVADGDKTDILIKMTP
jgi:hypothetical protein